MSKSIRISDEAYEVVSRAADADGRTVPKQAERMIMGEASAAPGGNEGVLERLDFVIGLIEQLHDMSGMVGQPAGHYPGTVSTGGQMVDTSTGEIVSALPSSALNQSNGFGQVESAIRDTNTIETFGGQSVEVPKGFGPIAVDRAMRFPPKLLEANQTNETKARLEIIQKYIEAGTGNGWMKTSQYQAMMAELAELEDF